MMIKCIVSVYLIVVGTGNTFEQLKAEMESKVVALATEMENIFAKRC